MVVTYAVGIYGISRQGYTTVPQQHTLQELNLTVTRTLPGRKLTQLILLSLFSVWKLYLHINYGVVFYNIHVTHYNAYTHPPGCTDTVRF